MNLNNYNKISLKDLVDNVPPRFIKSLESCFDLNNLQIFKSIYGIGNFLIETNQCECYLCKKCINYENIKTRMDYFILNKINILNENILYKIDNIKLKKEKDNRIFMCEIKINSDIYIEKKYHLCNTCFENSLYYWYIKYDKKYPSTRIDGYNFIHKNNKFVPEIKLQKSLNKIKNIKFPMIFKCEYYNNSKNLNKYNFMNNL